MRASALLRPLTTKSGTTVASGQASEAAIEEMLSQGLWNGRSRNASFLNLYRKASEPGIYAALRGRFRGIPDDWNDDTRVIPGLSGEDTKRPLASWRHKDRDEFGKSFDDGWAIAVNAVSRLEKAETAEKIGTSLVDAVRGFVSARIPKPIKMKQSSLIFLNLGIPTSSLSRARIHTRQRVLLVARRRFSKRNSSIVYGQISSRS